MSTVFRILFDTSIAKEGLIRALAQCHKLVTLVHVRVLKTKEFYGWNIIEDLR